MRKLIRDRQVVEDHWQTVTTGEAVPATGDVIVPLATFLADTPALLDRQGRLGVLLQPGDGITELAPHLARIALVAINFPVFFDGRGLSCARELRERHGFHGEIRAVGDVQRDVLFGMHRCGFNAFVLPEGKSPESALAAFGDFSTAYQGDVHQPLPVYRR